MSGGTLSCAYGKGWRADDVTGEVEESVYATVAEVDMFRNGCVNPAVSFDGEIRAPKPGKSDVAVECKLSPRRSHDNDADVKRYRVSLSRKTEQKPRHKPEQSRTTNAVIHQTTKTVNQAPKHVTVIDVHKSFHDEDSETSSEPASPVLHTSACLDSCMYAPVTPPSTRCRECNISRPPRRRDPERRGYDNNLSVKRQYRADK